MSKKTKKASEVITDGPEADAVIITGKAKAEKAKPKAKAKPTPISCKGEPNTGDLRQGRWIMVHSPKHDKSYQAQVLRIDGTTVIYKWGHTGNGDEHKVPVSKVVLSGKPKAKPKKKKDEAVIA